MISGGRECGGASILGDAVGILLALHKGSRASRVAGDREFVRLFRLEVGPSSDASAEARRNG